ncbi:MAG: ribonuclease HIII [Candidatus Cloacimonetes bacterium]|nr:ribonuclease HIII [Candidatus Cloacimonadota bacterium]
MHEKILATMARLLEQAPSLGLRLADEKPIPHGVQLTFEHEGGRGTLNIYHSMKKGVSLVPGGKKNTAIRAKLQALANKPVGDVVDEQARLHSWSRWAGTDESGKGDWFGPLVACGFVVDDQVLPLLRELGVQDSKRMSDRAVREAAATLESKCRRRIETVALSPTKYNALYADFRAQGRNLNDLLAWMHGRAIANLAERFKLDGAVIDRFTHVSRIRRNLGTASSLDIVDVVRGERDPAVAAASVLARNRFLCELDALSARYGFTIPRGAGKHVDEAGVFFADKFSFDRIGEVAKLHFVNTVKLSDRIRSGS